MTSATLQCASSINYNTHLAPGLMVLAFHMTGCYWWGCDTEGQFWLGFWTTMTVTDNFGVTRSRDHCLNQFPTQKCPVVQQFKNPIPKSVVCSFSFSPVYRTGGQRHFKSLEEREKWAASHFIGCRVILALLEIQSWLEYFFNVQHKSTAIKWTYEKLATLSMTEITILLLKHVLKLQNIWHRSLIF